MAVPVATVQPVCWPWLDRDVDHAAPVFSDGEFRGPWVLGRPPRKDAQGDRHPPAGLLEQVGHDATHAVHLVVHDGGMDDLALDIAHLHIEAVERVFHTQDFHLEIAQRDTSGKRRRAQGRLADLHGEHGRRLVRHDSLAPVC